MILQEMSQPTQLFISLKVSKQVDLPMPTHVAVIPLMVKHTTEGYNGMDNDEVDDFE